MRETMREESALSHLVACGSRVTRDLIRSLLKAARSLAPALDLRWAFGTHRAIGRKVRCRYIERTCEEATLITRTSH